MSAEDKASRGEGGKWLPGQSPNPGGRPRKLVEIERMLDAEFRDLESTRENYRTLRELALFGVVNDVFDAQGARVGQKTTHHPAYMEQLFNRLYGPVKDLDLDFSDATDDQLGYLRDKLKLRQ